MDWGGDDDSECASPWSLSSTIHEQPPHLVDETMDAHTLLPATAEDLLSPNGAVRAREVLKGSTPRPAATFGEGGTPTPHRPSAPGSLHSVYSVGGTNHLESAYTPFGGAPPSRSDSQMTASPSPQLELLPSYTPFVADRRQRSGGDSLPARSVYLHARTSASPGLTQVDLWPGGTQLDLDRGGTQVAMTTPMSKGGDGVQASAGIRAAASPPSGAPSTSASGSSASSVARPGSSSSTASSPEETSAERLRMRCRVRVDDLIFGIPTDGCALSQLAHAPARCAPPALILPVPSARIRLALPQESLFP